MTTVQNNTRNAGDSAYGLGVGALTTGLIALFLPNMYLSTLLLVGVFVLGLTAIIINVNRKAIGGLIVGVAATLLGAIGVVISILISIQYQSGNLS